MLKSLCVCKVSIMSLKVSTSMRNSSWTEWRTIATLRINYQTSTTCSAPTDHDDKSWVWSGLQTLHLILIELWNAQNYFSRQFDLCTINKFLENIKFDPVGLHYTVHSLYWHLGQGGSCKFDLVHIQDKCNILVIFSVLHIFLQSIFQLS